MRRAQRYLNRRYWHDARSQGPQTEWDDGHKLWKCEGILMLQSGNGWKLLNHQNNNLVYIDGPAKTGLSGCGVRKFKLYRKTKP
jgi:hypothetical protein